MNIKIHDYTGKMRQVVCPDCGTLGANKGPCWCHKCHAAGGEVMMLPSWNGFIHASWTETDK